MRRKWVAPMEEAWTRETKDAIQAAEGCEVWLLVTERDVMALANWELPDRVREQAAKALAELTAALSEPVP